MIDDLRARCPQLEHGDDVICAVSGGPDSMALLALAVHAGCQVTAIHVDHGLRPGSAVEADLVSEAATRFGARFRSESVTVGAGPNLEARARAARYAILGPDALTGHTADDHVETMMINMLRGGAVGGLSGMRPHRHPLLGIRRSETHELCQSLAITTVDDPTNRSPAHLRNRIRAELLPMMTDLARRDLVPLLVRQAGVWRDDDDLLDALADGIDPTDARALTAAPTALARRAVRKWLTEEHPPDLATVERVLRVARGEVQACETNDGRKVKRHRQRLSLDGPSLR